MCKPVHLEPLERDKGIDVMAPSGHSGSYWCNSPLELRRKHPHRFQQGTSWRSSAQKWSCGKIRGDEFSRPLSSTSLWGTLVSLAGKEPMVAVLSYARLVRRLAAHNNNGLRSSADAVHAFDVDGDGYESSSGTRGSTGFSRGPLRSAPRIPDKASGAA